MIPYFNGMIVLWDGRGEDTGGRKEICSRAVTKDVLSSSRYSFVFFLSFNIEGKRRAFGSIYIFYR